VVAVFLSLLLLATLGCGGDGREDPILRLSAAEALAQGQALMAEKKYRDAKKYLVHAFEVEPNSVSGRDGLLLAADSLYFAGGLSNLTEAETRYRDFLNRFPTSERSDYAQFRIAMTLAARMEKPNRDQKTTAKAVDEFENLLRLYPTSPYATEAQQELIRVRNNLAESEYLIGMFYMRYGCRKGQRTAVCRSAGSRFDYLLDNYPNYDQKDKVYYQLCRAYSSLEAVPEGSYDGCALLREKYPQSPYAAKIAGIEKSGASAAKKMTREAQRRQKAAEKRRAKNKPPKPDEDPEADPGNG
jgi:outer membrane protein assembly factor BamD